MFIPAGTVIATASSLPFFSDKIAQTIALSDTTGVSVSTDISLLFNTLTQQYPEIEIVNWGETPKADLIINATSLGLKDDENINIDYSKVGSGKFFYDVIYNPSETKFLKFAKKTGNKTENGKKMFIYQAQASFKIWNSLEPTIDEKVMELVN